MRVTSMQSLYNSSDLESHVDQIDVKKNNLDLINNWNSQGYNTVYKKECYDFYHKGEIPCDKDYIYVDIYNKFLKPSICFLYYRHGYFLSKLSLEELKDYLQNKCEHNPLYEIRIKTSTFTSDYLTKLVLLNEERSGYYTRPMYQGDEPIYIGAFINMSEYRRLCKQCSSKIINEMLYQEKDCLLVNESEVKNKVNLIINEIIQ